ncbi:aspartic endopeptidase [Aspergillus lucknowensis]|uniref:Signal peptide peptidase n=1 Tax=Aspergillus lucknowensis TaxID=176173 RepID=A0ABR4M4R4_9EURO
MAEVSPFAEVLGQALYHFALAKPLLPTYGHVVLSALFPLYIGAHASLSRPSSAAKPTETPGKAAENESDDDDEEDEEQDADQRMEGLAPSDAVMFPLTAGATLGGLYVAIKWFGANTLNKILGFYFSLMGIFFAMAFLKDCLLVLRSFIFPRRYTRRGQTWKPRATERIFAAVRSPPSLEPVEVRESPLPGVLSSIPLPRIVLVSLWTFREILYWRAKLRFHVHRVVHLDCSIGTLDILGVLLALPAVVQFAFVSKPWWLTNFFGFSFCYGTLQLMSPSTFVTGSLILGSLFFYDIYFVYFTPLMVTVAKNLDVPIKLLFPRPPTPSEAPDTGSLAMLGLGDIIIPGMMVGLALRFDLFVYYKRKGTLKARAEGKASGFVKPVFQPATGRWGERFWAPPVTSNEPQLEIPYNDARSFPKTYFKASMVGYTLGMLMTLAVMQMFDHPQPALLYLVPGILLSLWGTALIKGQVHEMWEFSDAEEDEEDASDKEGEKDQNEGPVSSDKGRGLFARLFSDSSDNEGFGKVKKGNQEPVPSGKATDATGQEKSDSNVKTKPQFDGKEESKHLDLFLLSIYVPRKVNSNKPQDQGDTIKSALDEESRSYVAVGNQANEPPAKRRRRSPRNAAANSQ